MSQSISGTATRERLLTVASELFAEKGYPNTSIADITKLAGANKAAVNYHFGSKEKLYQEAWQHAHELLVREVPPDGGVGDNRPPAERLCGRIRAGVQKAMSGDAIVFRIMRKEMASPTGLLDRVIQDTIKPIRQATQEILHQLIGPGADNLDIDICEVCVVAPWMHIAHHRLAERYDGLCPVFREDMLESMVDRLTTFVLAGVEAVRKRIAEQSQGH